MVACWDASDCSARMRRLGLYPRDGIDPETGRATLERIFSRVRREAA